MKRLLALLLFSGFAYAGDPIQIAAGANLTISVTSSSATVTLPTAGLESARQVELQNVGSAAIFVEFCPTSTCTAAIATSYPILAGQSKIVTIKGNTTNIATIAVAAQTLYVSVGVGE